MKNRFTTLDIVYLVHELRDKLVGLRVDQIYDIDKKTYLIRLVKSGVKKVLLVDSGSRFHTTQFDWPKNPAPSGFTMKLRKHLNNKRLEKLEQVGADRILHLQFGMDSAAYHLFLELYDKGNLILTDHTFTILHLVRPRIAGQERLAAHEKYAWENAKQTYAIDRGQIEDIMKNKPSGTLREVFLPKVEFGVALFSHVLRRVGLSMQTKIPQLIDTEDGLKATVDKLTDAFIQGTQILTTVQSHEGIITRKQSVKQGELAPQGGPQQQFYDEFHPAILKESFGDGILCYESFDESVDEFFSKVEAQKVDMKQLNQEKEAIRKLEKVKLGQQQRLQELQDSQELDKQKAELITINQASVDLAISTIRKLVANQIPWDAIEEQLKEARTVGDPLASMITKLNLKQGKMTLNLRNVYDEDLEPINIDIDLNLSAFANATKYFDQKKTSARKEIKAIESQGKAIKATERKTMASLKEAAAIHTIKKARKVLWFEKFRWFISSENYLVLAGRDAQQNELLVKRYLRPRDVYMHADSHGSPTLIIKNDTPAEDVLPKTLNEAGVFAVSCSGSWENKVVPSSWWVWGDQVSKSAPTGEYLPTGSFMIRGKKNYLPPYQLVLGFGLLFRLTDDCMEAHKNERSRRTGTGDAMGDNNEVEEDIADAEDEFPDTHVNLNVEGNVVMGAEEDDAEYFVTSAVATSINSSVQKMRNKEKKNAKAAKGQAKNKGNPPPKKNPDVLVEEEPQNQPGPHKKRGQHGKKKKLREKYADQDEEERQLRMKLLRGGEAAIKELKESASVNKSEVSDSEVDSDTKTAETAEHGRSSMESTAASTRGTSIGGDLEKPGELQESSKAKEDNQPTEPHPQPEPDEEEETKEGESELDVLKCLTGSPLEQDELLYSIPVVAPYSTLQNYKFRIKMIPGNTKRGKASKTALEFFLRDKDATQREKDLMKAVKDQDFARNFPGKVKLSNIVRDKK